MSEDIEGSKEFRLELRYMWAMVLAVVFITNFFSVDQHIENSSDFFKCFLFWGFRHLCIRQKICYMQCLSQNVPLWPDRCHCAKIRKTFVKKKHGTGPSTLESCKEYF